MKRHRKQPDGFKCSDYKLFARRKMKWVNTLKVGDNIRTCRGTIEEISEIWPDEDVLKTTKGFYCSPYQCCEPARMRMDAKMREWAKRSPKEFFEYLNNIAYCEASDV